MRHGGSAHARMPARNLGALLLILVLMTLVYAPVFREFVAAWLQYEEYNYAIWVPIIALFLLARRWPTLRRQPLAPNGHGLTLLGAGLAMLVTGTAMDVHVLQGLSFIPAMLGLVWLLWGRGAARLTLFPIAYLACGLGLYRGLVSSLGFTLQGVTARNATVLANALGVHAVRHGLLLSTNHTTYLVAETCSGLSSLLALLALGWVLIGEAPGSLRSKIILCLAITPLALLANTVRVALVLVIAQDISAAVAVGFVHNLFGASIFFLTVALLLLVRKVVLWFDNSASRSWRPAS